MKYDAKTLAEKTVKILDSKKAADIKLLYVGDLTTLAEYFIICTGNSSTQVNALSDAVDEKLSLEGVEPHHIEGLRGGQWVLMDYGSVIIHIMYKEARNFYNIERLWADAPSIDVAPIVDEGEVK